MFFNSFMSDTKSMPKSAAQLVRKEFVHPHAGCIAKFAAASLLLKKCLQYHMVCHVRHADNVFQNLIC